MNWLSITAIFEPGHVKVRTYHREDGSPSAALALGDYDGHNLDVHITDLAHAAELASALSEVREFLTDELAASDAA